MNTMKYSKYIISFGERSVLFYFDFFDSGEISTV